MKKISFLLILLAISILANSTLSNSEKGYAIGAGFGIAQMINMNHYGLTKEQKIEKCNENLQHNQFATRSKDHFNIALEECLKNLK